MSTAQPTTENTPYTKELADGETLENLLIQGSGKVEIRASGSNWAIRNLGLDGCTNRDSSLFRLHVSDPNGAGIVDNVHINSNDDQTNSIFVNASHAGNLTLSNSYFNGPLEDVIYDSPSSNPDTTAWANATGKQRGQGGTLRADNVFMSDINDYGLRYGVGRATNCVAVNVGVAYASLYREATFEGCHASGGGTTLRVGTPVDNNRRYTPNTVVANISDCQFEGGQSGFDIRSGGGGMGQVNGTPGSQPSGQVPAGVPTTPQQAAQGNSSATPQPFASLDRSLELQPGPQARQFRFAASEGIQQINPDDPIDEENDDPSLN